MCDAGFVASFVLLAYGLITPAWVITGTVILVQLVFGSIIVTSLLLACIASRKQSSTHTSFNQIP